MTSSDFDPATQVLNDISGDYTIDTSHTRLGFSARHAMVATVHGQFDDFTGTAHIDTATPANSTVELRVLTRSINTGNDQRDGHLRSGDFFEAETHPEITFASTEVTRDGAEWTITGDLTIKGVTHPVTVPFEYSGSAVDPMGGTRLGFEGELTLSRKAWGLTWNASLETGGVLVSDKVKLHFDVTAVRSDPQS